MKSLLVYLVENLISAGEISKCDYKIAGEDCINLSVGTTLLVFTHYDLILLNKLFLDRLPYISDEQIAIWKRLLSYL